MVGGVLASSDGDDLDMAGDSGGVAYAIDNCPHVEIASQCSDSLDKTIFGMTPTESDCCVLSKEQRVLGMDSHPVCVSCGCVSWLCVRRTKRARV